MWNAYVLRQFLGIIVQCSQNGVTVWSGQLIDADNDNGFLGILQTLR